MEITVNLTDGRTLAASPGIREFVEFEREFGVSASDFEDGGRLEWLMFLVHASLVNDDATDVPEELDEFLALVADIDAEEDEEVPPTSDEAAPAA